MGHYSHCCKLTGIPITGGSPVVLIVMKHVDSLYDNSEKSLQKFGKTYMCSNEGTRLKYMPCWFPIHGTYDEYGGIENIVKDDNTAVLEKYYDLTIEEIMGIITSGRKDDGYDDSLKPIKKPVKRPKDQLEGENHFDYYQRIMKDPMPFGNGRYPDESNRGTNPKKPWTVIRDGKKVSATKEEYDADIKLIHEQYARYTEWKKTNPDVEDDYGKPNYKERYKELLTYSGMWVRGDVYNELTNISKNDPYDKLDFGRPELLKALGFVEGEKTKQERYNRPFTYGKLTVMTDGTWLANSIYTIKDFKKLAESNGETIDFSIIENKDKIEQFYDIIIPTIELDDEASKLVDIFENGEPSDLQKYFKKSGIDTDSEEGKETIRKIIRDSLKRMGGSRENMQLYYYFLNTDGYSSSRIENPMTTEYLRAAKEGKIKDNLVRFWRFDHYMFVCGRYYEIVGTSPQDGERNDVLKVLTVAKNILEAEVKEYNDGNDNEEDEE